ncbi:hypothetical protein FB446DRAFT_539189 [Lentinula raphanica]|nr:hypothetical protein FB446DRAFT_539189 [Lentinula raphanica]
MDVQPPDSSQFKATTSEKPRRLPPEGVQILREALDNGLTHPKKAERKELLRRIHALGITWYTDEKLKTWFISTRRRQQQLDAQATKTQPTASNTTDTVDDATPLADNTKLTIKIPPGGGSTAKPGADSPATASAAESPYHVDTFRLKVPTVPKPPKKTRLTDYPSIRLSAVPQLIILADTTPNPTQKLIETWAVLLKASPEDVDRWVKDRKAHEDQVAAQAQGTSSATPSGSVEPGRKSEQPDGSGHEDEHSTASAVPPQSQFELEWQLPSASTIPPRNRLLLAIHNKISSIPDDSSSPKTAAEFAAFFAPYQTKMESFLHDVETGKLESMGWDFHRVQS